MKKALALVAVLVLPQAACIPMIAGSMSGGAAGRAAAAEISTAANADKDAGAR